MPFHIASNKLKLDAFSSKLEVVEEGNSQGTLVLGSIAGSCGPAKWRKEALSELEQAAKLGAHSQLRPQVELQLVRRVQNLRESRRCVRERRAFASQLQSIRP